MRIALISPPWYRVPPDRYGGIENLVADLADGLRARGHAVAVIATSDSEEPGLMPTGVDHRPDELGLELPAVLHQLAAERILNEWRPDVVHDHTLTGAVAAPARPVPTVLTAHGAAIGDYGRLLAAAAHTSHVVAISRSQARNGLRDIMWADVVPNGIEVQRYPLGTYRAAHLVFLGRMSPEKGCAEAVQVARRAGRHLVIGARVQGEEEQGYFDRHVRPFLGQGVTYAGELDFEGKVELLSTSAALLSPLQWEEPYGLVAAEAQACGTPVITMRRGAMPELVRHGVTGFLCSDISQLVRAIASLDSINPQDCRRHAEDCLDISRTAEGYERVYARAIEGRTPAGRSLMRSPGLSG